MTPNELTESSQRASDRYVVLLNAFRGLLSQTTRKNPVDVRARRALRENALEVARTYLMTEVGISSDEIEKAVSEEIFRFNAMTGANVTLEDDVIEDVIEAAEERLATEIRAQIERDIILLQSRHKDFQIETFMTSQSERVDLETAKFRVLMRGSDQVRFFARDRIGRRIQSQKFVRTVWRDTLLQAGNEAFLLAASLAGIEKLVVDHPDKNASANGVVISTSPNLVGDNSYADIRDEVFHPNSQARLGVA